MSTVDSLLEVLDLEPLEKNLFRGQSQLTPWKRVFGGQVIAQALMAAIRTVEGRKVHSLHAYFLLGGDPEAPIIYDVERVRDGRSFTTRRVVAIQHGEVIFIMSVSFHTLEPGYAHQDGMPDVPSPEDLPDEAALRALYQDRISGTRLQYWKRERPIELRLVEHETHFLRKPVLPVQHMWFRTRSSLPDDPAIHACILAYASDMSLLDTAMIAHGKSVADPDIQPASLDHALWFHQDFKADDWLLYALDSPWAGHARGLGRGRIYSRDGRLVASAIQEGLVRPRRAE